MKIELTRRQPGLESGAGTPVDQRSAAAPFAAGRAEAVDEADFAPPAAPMAMPKQQIEAGHRPLWLRLPGFGGRMQGQP
ncbi:hypothetical protein [Pseudodonghicola flavimaris]|uniref:Uncharacterized protein n=1 Tax=Pseudodonghicola flavimaris TaxID=3050036 RepID=A0ABT7F884_9RHOB|nr:hypothetical protein [Pseudodonghicola flavimaris]MDK3020811.1 hypothetical protein [Pseudodonghicola flavimaris]